ncbi:MAG: DUF4445 domain-containing protein [Lachnospiraceae bacterium]|nr:DUF4445 domain-containing protein [Lachnospiraceae bacterium]
MDNIVIVEGKGEELSIAKEAVFRQIRCDRENPLYETYSEEFEELLPEIRKLVKPRAAMGFFSYPGGLAGGIPAGKEVLYLIITVGPEVTELTSRYFEEGDYVKGMLADAMSSAAIGAFEEPVLRRLRELCEKRGVGIRKRYEAPGHVPMAIQKVAYDALNAKETLGLDISSGFMYDPVKSTCQVFEVSENPRVLHLTHGCSDCSNTDCPNRMESAVITVKDPAGDYEIAAVLGSNLLTVLRENGISVSAPCGGAGRCGKCVVRVLLGEIEATADSQRFFSQKELAEGKRLACKSIVNGNCTIEILSQAEEEMLAVGAETESETVIKSKIETETKTKTKTVAEARKAETCKEEPCGIAIYIGTTTLAFALVSLRDGKTLVTHTAINRQRRYGADVITRIEAADNGKAKELQDSIREDLRDGIRKLLSDNTIDCSTVKAAAIAGNTTMLHLLMGYPTKGLGVYPFTAHTLELEERSLFEIFGKEWEEGKDLPGRLAELWDLPVFLFPGFSVYVGADIVSGVYSLDFHKSEKINALIDLGTNGEMAIGNKERLLVTSTAAGPAFEGGNITCGIGSITGAISNVTIAINTKPTVILKTIGDEAPIGICGTGVIETVSELVRNELVDETGMMDEEYFEEGFPLAEKDDGGQILFTQKDVREIQLAKSAIRAGLEVLLKRFGINYEGLSHLYIAGGFGYYLDAGKAAGIGLIPGELLPKTRAVGNSSLNGAIRFLREWWEADPLSDLVQLAKQGEEIGLSSDPDFNDFYMEYMMFEEED